VAGDPSLSSAHRRLGSTRTAGSCRALICTLPSPAPTFALLPLIHLLPQQRAPPQHKPRGCTPNQQRFVPWCPSGQPRSSWPDTRGLLDLNFAPQRVLLPPAAPPRADGPLAPRARSSGRAESRSAQFLDLSNRTCRGPPASGSLRRCCGGLTWRRAPSGGALAPSTVAKRGRSRLSRRAESRTTLISL
jgi:hypothetical protein